MKSKLFKTAWYLFNNFSEKFKSFGAALKMAWKKIKFEIILKTGNIQFTFEKKNKTKRAAYGTHLANTSYERKTTQTRTVKPSLVYYYDLEKEAVRCFHIWQLR